jgi:hypothetical protein
MLISYRADSFAADSYIVIWGQDTFSIASPCNEILLRVDEISPSQRSNLLLHLSWAKAMQIGVPCSLSRQQMSDLVAALMIASEVFVSSLATVAAVLPAPTVFSPVRAPPRKRWYSSADEYPIR